MKKFVLLIACGLMTTTVYSQSMNISIGKISKNPIQTSEHQTLLNTLNENRQAFKNRNFSQILVPNDIYSRIEQSELDNVTKGYLHILFHFYTALRTGSINEFDESRSRVDDLIQSNIPAELLQTLRYLKCIIEYEQFKLNNSERLLIQTQQELDTINLASISDPAIRTSIQLLKAIVKVAICQKNLVGIADQINLCGQVDQILAGIQSTAWATDIVLYLKITNLYRKMVLEDVLAEKREIFEQLQQITPSNPAQTFQEYIEINRFKIDLYGYGFAFIDSLPAINDNLMQTYTTILVNLKNQNYMASFPQFIDGNAEINLWNLIFRYLNICSSIIENSGVTTSNSLSNLRSELTALQFPSNFEILTPIRNFFISEVSFLQRFFMSQGTSLSYNLSNDDRNRLPEAFQKIARYRENLCSVWQGQVVATDNLIDYNSHSPLIYWFYLARIAASQNFDSRRNHYEGIIRVCDTALSNTGDGGFKREKLILLKYQAAQKLWDILGTDPPAAVNWQTDLNSVINAGDANLAAQAHYLKALFFDKSGDTHNEDTEIELVNNHDLLGTIVSDINAYTDDPATYRWNGFMVNHLDNPLIPLRGYPQIYSSRNDGSDVTYNCPNFGFALVLLNLLRNYPVQENLLAIYPFPLTETQTSFFTVLHDGVVLGNPVEIVFESAEQSQPEMQVQISPPNGISIEREAGKVILRNVQPFTDYEIAVYKRGSFPKFFRTQFTVSKTIQVNFDQAKSLKLVKQIIIPLNFKQKYILALDFSSNEIAYILSAGGMKFIGMLSSDQQSPSDSLFLVFAKGYDPISLKISGSRKIKFFDNLHNGIYELDMHTKEIVPSLNFDNLDLFPSQVLFDDDNIMSILDLKTRQIKRIDLIGQIYTSLSIEEDIQPFLLKKLNEDYYAEYASSQNAKQISMPANIFISDFIPKADYIYALNTNQSLLSLFDSGTFNKIVDLKLEKMELPFCIYIDENEVIIGGINTINIYEMIDDTNYSYNPIGK